MTTTTRPAGLASLLHERARTIRQVRAVDSTAPAGKESTSALMLRAELDEFDAELRTSYPHVDVAFRTAISLGNPLDIPIEQRALGATALTSTRRTMFVDAFMGAAVEAAPLLDLATVVPTESGESLDLGWGLTVPTANGVTAPGSAITVGDPTFDGDPLRAWKYPAILLVSAELSSDSFMDFEKYAADRLAPAQAREFAADAWGGSGTNEPEGLLASLSTVNAAGAAVVTFDDITNLLNGVPAAYRYSGRCTIMLSPGAHIDLLLEDPNYAWHTGTIHGFPFVVDPALADPATTTKSVVAGDISSAYIVRLLPLRIESDAKGKKATDQIQIRCILRGDGKPMVPNAARALVHP